jgi:hypothetical protein
MDVVAIQADQAVCGVMAVLLHGLDVHVKPWAAP